MEYPSFILVAIPYMAAYASKVQYGLMCWAIGLGTGYILSKVKRKINEKI